MKIRNRAIFNVILDLAIAVALIIIGRGREGLLFTMGCSLLIATVLIAIRNIITFTNPNRRRKYEVAYNDERNQHIARKSYTAAFYASIWAEFIALIYFAYKNMVGYTDLMAYLICGQVIVHILATAWYRRKN